ncbi:MAG TPA: glycosyltransferase family 2 protein [Candidatus Obscuribacterales bacterium]
MYRAPTHAAMHPAAVLVHYRQAQLTARCISSLLDHCYDLQAIFVVDNSSDDSLGSLQRQFSDPRIHWLPQPSNLGFGEGCNAGIAAALASGADAVLLINNDAWVEQDILTALNEASRRYHHRALLTGQIFTPDGQLWYAGGDYSLYTVRTRHWTRPLQRERRVPFACGCLLWLPRPLLEALTGFAPDYFLYLEDLELCLRARQAGFPIVCLPQVQIRHSPSSSTGGRDSPLAVYYQNRNRWLLLRQHGRLRHWPVFVAVYLLGFLRRLLKPQRRASLAAVADALSGKWGKRP